MDTRSWRTNYRGTIIIHTAKRRNIGELTTYGRMPSWRGALNGVLSKADGSALLSLPFGCLIGAGELTACIATEWLHRRDLDQVRQDEVDRFGQCQWTERMMGNFSPGRYAWVFDDLRTFDVPIPCHGRQGLFLLPPGFDIAATGGG